MEMRLSEEVIMCNKLLHDFARRADEELRPELCQQFQHAKIATVIASGLSLTRFLAMLQTGRHVA